MYVDGKLKGVLVDIVCKKINKEVSVFISTDLSDASSSNIKSIELYKYFWGDGDVELRVDIVCPGCGRNHYIIVPIEIENEED